MIGEMISHYKIIEKVPSFPTSVLQRVAENLRIPACPEGFLKAGRPTSFVGTYIRSKV
jgi:hypothetical protein